MTAPRPVDQAPASDPRPGTRPAEAAGGKAHWDALTTEKVAVGGYTWQEIRDGYQSDDDPVLRGVEPLPYSGTVPPNLRTTARTTTTVALAWDPPQGGATNYRVRDGGVDVSGATALTGTTYTHTGLTAGTTHNYTVSAVKGGVRGPETPVVTATTLAS